MENKDIKQMFETKQKRIETFFNEKQENITRSVAVNNACLLIANLYKDLEVDEVKKRISDLSEYIYNLLTNK